MRVTLSILTWADGDFTDWQATVLHLDLEQHSTTQLKTYMKCLKFNWYIPTPVPYLIVVYDLVWTLLTTDQAQLTTVVIFITLKRKYFDSSDFMSSDVDCKFINQWKLVTFVVCLFLFTTHYAELRRDIITFPLPKKCRQDPVFVVSCLATVNLMSHVGKNKLTNFIAASF